MNAADHYQAACLLLEDVVSTLNQVSPSLGHELVDLDVWEAAHLYVGMAQTHAQLARVILDAQRGGLVPMGDHQTWETALSRPWGQDEKPESGGGQDG